MNTPQRVFITGGTGYIGSRLIPLLVAAGHPVTALAREGSQRRLPPGCIPLIGNALSGDCYRGAVETADVFIQLVGVRHPSPAKAEEFVSVDLRAALEAVRIATVSKVGHFIYLSVAHPAPAMRDYIQVRMKGEAAIAESGLRATILRPWYVLGPGHRWPAVLTPFYWLAERFPATRASATRLAMVTIHQMLGTLLQAVAETPSGIRILEPMDIRRLGNAHPISVPSPSSKPASTSQQ